MKIGIMSDTHDNTPAIVWMIEYLNDHQIEICLHAGDMINPGILHRFRDHFKGQLHFVFGNNDGERSLATSRSLEAKNLNCHLLEMRLEFAGRKIFMNHYSTLSESIARSGEFEICIGGHDHEYRVTKYQKSIFINPGNTVTKDKWLPQEVDKVSSFVILDLENLETERIIVPLDL